MSKDYKSLHPIPAEHFAEGSVNLPTNPYSGFEGGGTFIDMARGYISPIQYSGWIDEALAWHKTCTLHAALNPAPVCRVKGPEAARFMREHFVNKIEDWPINRQKHGILVTPDEGLIVTHGVILRIAEDEYELWWHSPYVNYLFDKWEGDAELIDMTNKLYMHQLQGPLSKDLIEDLCGESIDDIDWLCCRDVTIDGRKSRCLRFGMSGVQGYELQGDMADAQYIYKRLCEVGNKYGLRRLGFESYAMEHTEGGFPNLVSHFMSAGALDKDYMAYIAANSNDQEDQGFNRPLVLTGSLGDHPEKTMYTPYDLGLGRCCNFNHEFQGKAALEKIRDNQTRNITAVEWDVEDWVDIYRSQCQTKEEPYKFMDVWGPDSVFHGFYELRTDLVVNKDGKVVGQALGHIYSPWYRALVSMVVLDLDYHKEDAEIYLLWGDEGQRQKKVRLYVKGYPYNKETELDQYRNRNVGYN